MNRLWVVIATLTTATILICAGGIVYASHLKPVEPPVIVSPLNADTIFNLVNNERVKAGLRPLVRDDRLDASAKAKADDMVKYNYFDHVRDGKHGYEYIPVGMCSYKSENIENYTNPYFDSNKAVIYSFMQSTPHRDAILNKDYTLTGIAISGNKIVQHFCIAK